MGIARKACRHLIGAMGYDLVPRPAEPLSLESKYPPDFSKLDIETIERAIPYTMTSPERIYSLIRATEYVVRAQIPGDIVECGVWKGGSMMALATTLMRENDTARTLHLFDTFEGMTPPAEADRNFRGQCAAELLAAQPRESSWTWAVAPLEGVKQVMAETGYPGEVAYVQGRVEETIPASAPSRIALLRLDTDWYESTYHELVNLYPRLTPGGVLIIDDYGHWEGARRAVDQYLAENQIAILLNRIDYTGRIAIKPR